MINPKVRDALQSAWDQCGSLPPIMFTDSEANALARAVLLASREPSAGIIDAAWNVHDNSMGEVWQAMIDAALAE